ncbi:hypothetical protein BKA81DRAFT_197730 [Phyllosticta paracitricarpa]
MHAAANLNGEHGGWWLGVILPQTYMHRHTGCLLIPSQNGPAKSSARRIEFGIFHGRRTTLHHIPSPGTQPFPSLPGRARKCHGKLCMGSFAPCSMAICTYSLVRLPTSHRLSVCFHLRILFVPTQPITHLLLKRSTGKTEKEIAGQVARW